ncbi:hypothetical protein D3C87_1637740 [compost metagenome]
MSLNPVAPGVTGVVDNDVDTVKGIDRGVHQALGKALGGDAADAGNGFATRGVDLRDHLFGRFGIKVVNDNSRTVRRQFQSNAATDATTGTRHNGRFASEFVHLVTSLTAGLARKGLRNSVLRTLPTPDSGNATRNSTLRGHL